MIKNKKKGVMLFVCLIIFNQSKSTGECEKTFIKRKIQTRQSRIWIFGRGDRTDRLLRILPACRPNATHSVPDCALSAKNLPQAPFSIAETFSGSSPYAKKLRGTNLAANSS